ncbi:DUF5685 family protein [Verrucomicrobiaceae bacterium 227]
MFGYLGSPCHTCASSDTHSTYRSFFCGLSGALRDDYSPAARFLVNRDSTFLSLMTAAVSGHVPLPVQSTCCNPIAVPGPLFKDGLHAQYAAAVTICGLATKLEDDREDEKGLRRFAAKQLGRAVSGMTDRATSFLNTIRFPTSDVVEMMSAQSAIEQRKPDLLEAAAPTAMAYGTIFQHAAGIGGAPSQGNHLQALGENLGRLIYWKDAHDDRQQDAQRGRFNPLELSAPGEFDERFSKATTRFHHLAAETSGTFREVINDILSSTLARHQSVLPAGLVAQLGQSSSKPKKEKKKKNDRENKWWEHCCDIDCCRCPGSCSKSGNKRGPCDCLCDTGAGDSGCIDCGDCCPCN